MNDEEIIIADEESEIPCEDSAEELLKKYDRKRTQRADDIFAMQAVVCVLAAAAMLIANFACPEICAPVYDKIRALVWDGHELIPNPIDEILTRL
ncbi:MAG: hypothetical protein LUD57_02070 [Ruminococcus sp.]|nr:hypothetical protein [Ruminococcus sp.]